MSQVRILPSDIRQGIDLCISERSIWNRLLDLDAYVPQHMMKNLQRDTLKARHWNPSKLTNSGILTKMASYILAKIPPLKCVNWLECQWLAFNVSCSGCRIFDGLRQLLVARLNHSLAFGRKKKRHLHRENYTSISLIPSIR